MNAKDKAAADKAATLAAEDRAAAADKAATHAAKKQAAAPLDAATANIIAAAVQAAISAVRAEDDRRAEAVLEADRERFAERVQDEEEQAARNAARPSRRNDVTMDELDAVMPMFRAGSTIRIVGHRGFKAFAWREGDSRSDPAPFINVRPDDEVELPIHSNAERNQTAREMAHMHLAGFFAPV